MEHPFPSKDKVISNWASPKVPPDGVAALDGYTRNLVLDDPASNSFTVLMNFDLDSGWCNSPSGSEQMLASYGLFSSFQPATYASLDSLQFPGQSSASLLDIGDQLNGTGTTYNSDDKIGFQKTSSQLGLPSESNYSEDFANVQSNGAQGHSNAIEMANNVISKPVGFSIEEKMLKALSLFREYSGGGILAQVWVPVRRGEQYILTTSDQPYLLDQMLAGYREVSRTYSFSAEMKPGFPLGLPGRVFTSKVPEWTSNVIYYSSVEYLRVKHAIDHEVRGSIALPIFDPSNMSCCAVLELVTVKEKLGFDSEMESVSHALQAVDLRTVSPPRLLPQCLSKNQRDALSEITDVLRAVCHAHRLPLALTWIPCNYTEEDIDEIIKVHVRQGNSRSTGKCILCIETTACYVNDKRMEGFVHACLEHYIEEGQGIAGKALQSNHPFFFSDVKEYSITEYPLVHHARKYGLNAAVAIRLRSTYTDDEDYILEFFLPVNMKGSSEQQLLLNNLSGTMRRICKSLRTVSESELVIGEDVKCESGREGTPDYIPVSLARSAQTMLSKSNLSSFDKMSVYSSGSKNGEMEDISHEQMVMGSKRQSEKKRTTAEKNVSLSVLQQYFSGSLKDAAKSIGVCPTTLKRICRQHGISRWPSRKINKVNRSLRKIQTVLDSVQGVEGGLKFDPITGGFIAVSSILEFDSQKSLLNPPKDPNVKTSEAVTIHDVSAYAEPSCAYDDGSMVKIEDGEFPRISAEEGAKMKSVSPAIDCSENSESIAVGGGLLPQPNGRSAPWSCIKSAPSSSLGLNSGSMKSENLKPVFCRSSSSVVAVGGMENEMQVDDGILEHNQPNSSMTDSSNGSGSFMNVSSSSSQSFEGRKQIRLNLSCSEIGSKISVKATYKNDTVRFKFDPVLGCFQLYEEVAKRFKLQNGEFQLKYLDDEEEWVLLLCDSDLQECIDILDSIGTHCVKFLVRDMPLAIGSSGSSNCYLEGNS